MAYQYKLETLLNIRRNFEEQCQQKLAHENFVLDNHKQYLADLYTRRRNTVAVMGDSKQKVMPAPLFTFYVEAIRNKDREITFQQNAIAAQEEMVAQVQAELLEKVKERKIVERLKEKDYLAYMKEVAVKEQNENDEQAILRFGRERILT